MDTDALNQAVDDLGKQDRLRVLRLLKNLDVKICEHGDGCRVDLDRLTKEQRRLLCNLVESLSVISKVRLIEY